MFPPSNFSPPTRTNIRQNINLWTPCIYIIFLECDSISRGMRVSESERIIKPLGFQWDLIFFIFSSCSVIFVQEITNYEQICLYFSQKLSNVRLGGSIVTEVIEKYNGAHKCCPLLYLRSQWTDFWNSNTYLSCLELLKTIE